METLRNLLNTLDLDQVVITTGVIWTAWFAYRAHRSAKAVAPKVEETRAVVQEVKNAADTGNEKDLGHTVHSLEQQQEVVIAQVHTNTKELLMVAAQVSEVSAQVATVAEKLDRHLDEHGKVRNLLRRWLS